MKPKQLKKKLVLNKHSVSNLSNPEMTNARGGKDPVIPPSTYTCFDCDSNLSCPQNGGNCIMYAPGFVTETCHTVSPDDTCVSNAVTYCDLPCMPQI